MSILPSISKLRSVIENRSSYTPTPIGRYVAIIVVIIFAFTALAMALQPVNGFVEHFPDGGAVNDVSGVFLAMAGTLSLTSFLLHNDTQSRGRWFWFLMGVGFLYFSIDELTQIHEWTGNIIADRVGMPAHFRNWNDVIVILYGLVAVIVFTAYLPEILRFPQVAELMTLGLVLFVIQTALDSVIPGMGDTKVIVEESAKVAGSAFFARSALAAVMSVAARPVPRSPS